MGDRETLWQSSGSRRRSASFACTCAQYADDLVREKGHHQKCSFPATTSYCSVYSVPLWLRFNYSLFCIYSQAAVDATIKIDIYCIGGGGGVENSI